MDRVLLGGLSPREFLRRHWQKRPLLVRGAIPGFRNLVSVAALFRIAARDDAECRVVERHGTRWHLEHGPFDPAALRARPRSRWTLLVQGLNHHVPAADALLRRFSFVPYARLDDIMVSYAERDGGVGPHLDSYDVFLIQGEGRRRWRIGRQRDQALDPRAPLKILARFQPQQEWVLEPGDMLYLPPGVAHDGVALEPCMTYSIGFRAPSATELSRAFLAYLEETLAPRGMYADPDLRPCTSPGVLPEDFVARAAALLDGIRWTRRDVGRFLGRYVTEPKAHLRFAPPRPALAMGTFARRCAAHGIRLHPATLMLYRDGLVFMNGEETPLPRGTRSPLRALADRRALPAGASFTGDAVRLLYTWYRAGFLRPGADHE